MRRLVLVMAGLALVGGCGGSSGGGDRDEPAPRESATSAAPRQYTLAEVAAALPRSSQVPSAARKDMSCPGDEGCEDQVASVRFDLERPVPEQDQEQLADDAFLDDQAFVSAKPNASPEVAQQLQADGRKKLQKYVGDYDIAAKATGENRYNPGEQGSGTLTDVSIEGWTGYELSRTQRFAEPDKAPAEGVFELTQLDLTKDNVRVQVFVVTLSGLRGDVGASAMARQLATEYIQRLG